MTGESYAFPPRRAPRPDELDVLAAAGAELERGCSQVEDGQWNDPTPCSEWSIGDLVDHVVGGNTFTLEVLAGNSAEEAMATTVASFDDSYDRVAALAATLAAQHEAFARPTALEGLYDHVAGELTGVQLLRARLHDLIVHGWDLAQAVAPPATVADVLCQWAIDELRSGDSLTAAALEIDPAAIENQDSLLIAFGRADGQV